MIWHRSKLCIWYPENLLPLLLPGIIPMVWVLRSDTTSASLCLTPLKRGGIGRNKTAMRRKIIRMRIMNEKQNQVRTIAKMSCTEWKEMPIETNICFQRGSWEGQ